eukprot:TRINITY_DN75471_c0_g1_i1.p1 TRINITY_DN75471_c0_g1~~TRINITY_DN75471_c0_g1_i1.p1  ORF type:complete len:479 (-),score=65.19 TRINITY_DN75471_c0_g1_i1:498-1934(-)
MFDAVTRPWAFGAAAPGEYEESNQNFGSRIRGALMGSMLGFVMFIGAFGLLGWNEFNYVDNLKIIDKVESQAVLVSCTPNTTIAGRLIFASCPLSKVHNFTAEFAQSPWGGLLKNTPEGVWYSSRAMLLQWEEVEKCSTEKDKVGGGETTRCQYSYKQVWTNHVIDSSQFRCRSAQQAGCYFPTAPGVEGWLFRSGPEAVRNTGTIPSNLNFNWTAPFGDVAIGENHSTGDYILNDGLIGQISTPTSVKLRPDAMDVASKLNVLPGQTTALMGDTLHIRSNSSTETIGDLRANLFRAEYSTVGKSFVSVMAKQDMVLGSVALTKWISGMPGTMSTVNWLFEGHMEIDEFMGRIRALNDRQLYLLRFVGFIVMWLGLFLFTRPLAIIPDIIPCIGPLIGDLLESVLLYITFFIVLALSLLTIAFFWLAARPMYGLIALFLSTITFGSVCMLCCHCRRPYKEITEEEQPLIGRPVQAEYA